MCLATMTCIYAQLHVAVLGTGGEFQPVSNFTELRALTRAAPAVVNTNKANEATCGEHFQLSVISYTTGNTGNHGDTHW